MNDSIARDTGSHSEPPPELTTINNYTIPGTLFLIVSTFLTAHSNFPHQPSRRSPPGAIIYCLCCPKIRLEIRRAAKFPFLCTLYFVLCVFRRERWPFSLTLLRKTMYLVTCFCFVAVNYHSFRTAPTRAFGDKILGVRAINSSKSKKF